ncbi:MAG TPA: metallophosphoesterase [Syntrophobacteraceae bacterium]|nr:metallophosphoesterase [Syntrophobacteraceae bacterium]
MRLAVISDIHGNLEAFRQVLIDIDRSHIDQVLCLGDNIGYGPEPEAVVKLLRERHIPSVMGNHELGIKDPAIFHWFNSSAQASLLLTRQLISNDTLAFIANLPATHRLGDCLGVHGCPPDSVTRYLFDVSVEELAVLFRDLPQRLTFVGHTHDLELICWDGLELTRQELSPGVVSIQQSYRYLVNVGSVGQPRDGNNNAKYVIYDDADNLLEVRYVSYDIATTADKIIQLGFPRYYATRLW